jgi:hypothetical protein
LCRTAKTLFDKGAHALPLCIAQVRLILIRHEQKST